MSWELQMRPLDWPKIRILKARGGFRSRVHVLRVNGAGPDQFYLLPFLCGRGPCAELMRQINWDDEKQSWLLRGRSRAEFEEVLQRRPWLRHGPLLPRSPQPVHGLSLWWGQESAFMTWDRKELWIYGCYMD